MTLSEFLHARIDDDERLARAAASLPSSPASPASRTVAGVVTVPDAARLLAECVAKRRIVELAYEATGYDMTVDLERTSSARADSAIGFVGDRILEALALPYADHPDYDETWRPSW
jgi:hypothetical protein